MPEEIVYTELRCDFCGEQDPKWVYPVDDFTQELDPASPYKFEIEMLGSWSACQKCYELIEADNRESLLDHSLKAFGISKNSKVYDSVRSRVQRVHDEFFFCRLGEAIKEENYNNDDGYNPGVITIHTEDTF